MKRLVYSPKVEAFIKTDSGSYDISPYIVSGEVNRKINQVSTATISFRNPQFIWTDHKHKDINGNEILGPVFHPMDTISIAMTRINDRPIQVFTGYLDSAPYVSTYPGVVTIQASCTIKRLMHTYFDSGLPFFQDFLSAHNWQVNDRLGIVSVPDPATKNGGTKVLNDSSFGQLLFDTMTEIGGWNPDSILIENLPDGIENLVTGLFKQFEADSEMSYNEFAAFLKKIIGTSEYTGILSGSGASGSGNEAVPTTLTPVPGWRRIGNTVFGSERQNGTASGHSNSSWEWYDTSDGVDNYTATGFGYQGDNMRQIKWVYGEMGSVALGGKPHGYKFLVSPGNGRSLVLGKYDRNDQYDGSGRLMDIWIHAARWLYPNVKHYNDFPQQIYIKTIPQNTPLGPNAQVPK